MVGDKVMAESVGSDGLRRSGVGEDGAGASPGVAGGGGSVASEVSGREGR